MRTCDASMFQMFFFEGLQICMMTAHRKVVERSEKKREREMLPDPLKVSGAADVGVDALELRTSGCRGRRFPIWMEHEHVSRLLCRQRFRSSMYATCGV
jgi:hypothetical protein